MHFLQTEISGQPIPITNHEVIKWEDDFIHIVRQGAGLPDLPFGSTHRFVLNPEGSGESSFRDMKGNVLQETTFWFTVQGDMAPILVPTFPRPPNAYIQALERWAFWSHLPSDLQRTDLQLLAMVQEARETMQAYVILNQDRVFMTGFSASGAFTSKFTVLHREVIKASAAGGGWMAMRTRFQLEWH